MLLVWLEVAGSGVPSCIVLLRNRDTCCVLGFVVACLQVPVSSDTATWSLGSIYGSSRLSDRSDGSFFMFVLRLLCCKLAKCRCISLCAGRYHSTCCLAIPHSAASGTAHVPALVPVTLWI